MASPTQWLRQRYRPFWWVLFTLSGLPFINLIIDYYTGQLGANPLQTLQHTTGRWALIFLLVTLTITPLRYIMRRLCVFMHTHFGKRLEDWNWLVRLRRMLGLYCFFYASLHMLVYVLLDLSLNWTWAIQDINEKPYIVLGVIAYLLLIPLAVTSLTKFFKLMGKKKWQGLHKMIYLINILVIVHFWWQTKVGVYDYLPYLFVTIFLLGFRLFNWLGILRRHPRDDGMEATPRDYL